MRINTAILIEWGSRGRWFKSSHSDQKKTPETVDYSGFRCFFMPREKTVKNRQKQCYCYSGYHRFLELVRELPQVVQLHVLVVPQLLTGGVADQLDLVFLAAGGAFE